MDLRLLRSFEERAYAAIDSEKMVRVFDNLLMNAIKYSKDDGEIKVSLQRQRRDIQIVIANHSEEFTREELASLFERFYKKDQSRSRATEGSGLDWRLRKVLLNCKVVVFELNMKMVLFSLSSRYQL